MNKHITKRPAKGFTLIEILVALVVLSIGLLGVAALQLNSLRNNHSSAMRTQATFLAYDIIDRMRANRQDALDGLYVTNFGDEASEEDNVAAADIAAWKQNIASTLPAIDNDGTAEVADGAIVQNGNIFTVTIRWADWDDASGPGLRAPLEFSVDTQILN
jgi:type IV pilus assembly protein PilV